MRSSFLLSFVFLVVLCCLPVNGWRSFWKGRRFGGNLGHPTDSKGILNDGENEDLWFVQKLDHFEPMNVKTWKQVKFKNSFKLKVTINT